MLQDVIAGAAIAQIRASGQYVIKPRLERALMGLEVDTLDLQLLGKRVHARLCLAVRQRKIHAAIAQLGGGPLHRCQRRAQHLGLLVRVARRLPLRPGPEPGQRTAYGEQERHASADQRHLQHRTPPRHPAAT